MCTAKKSHGTLASFVMLQMRQGTFTNGWVNHSQSYVNIL
jgi:hypothetical protein